MIKRKGVFFVTLLVLLVLVLWILWGNYSIQVTKFTVSSRKIPSSFDGFTIAQVSDLHNAEFGEENERLLKLLREVEPDGIFLTGDLVDSRRTDMEAALTFAMEAEKIAPCYYVTGNHESRISEYPELEKGLKSIGVTVLRDNAVALTKNTESILLIGLEDPDFTGESSVVIEEKLSELKMEGCYTVLLSHRPELFETYRACGVELVFAGHAHGGQVRLPLVGGIIAPDQGLFPKYDAGMYCQKETNMIVSRGLGNSLFPFRVNNRPQLVVAVLNSR